ncbi:DNA-binding transcriptional MocR family regulator [Anoxybacillus voinovskiensis]|uniref:DNA-binding transcriptional MocR family regulator n=1 Tax=Anoxybacteroides voinovskiense TaxID=230470 RepID=A0A840DL43_9BACL|nr:PLP-dependent aminotransferase family protein [Anoxybacillus voinovskiensis]MBB4072425.1 DNA-binding transcriptional MocR family regulator [Anoxybacillus voinovskiensis]GGJ57999.1 GntR family transcriptional regulator [Anoxybacillus voinovskiensis]
MNIPLKRYSHVPVHEQICQYFIDRISSNMLKEGEQLPSVRQLAKELGVALVTVQKAYQLLQQKGYVESFQGKGIFVKQRTAIAHPPLDTKWQMLVHDYVPRAQSLAISQPLRNIRYNLATACLHGELFHMDWIRETTVHVIQQQPQLLSQYSSANGDMEFRKAVSQYIRTMSVPPEHILATSGAQQGIELVAKTFVGPNDVVLMEAPTYPGSIDVFKARGAQIIPIPVEQDGIDIKTLLRVCDQYRPTLLYTNPTFQNPTGTTLSMKKRKQLVDIAESYHFLILEDDPWSELYFDAPPPPPIKSFDKSGHVIYLKGFSKFLSPACRMGALIAEGRLLEKLIAAKSISDLGSPLLPQKIIAALLQSIQFEPSLQRLRHQLKQRAKQCHDLLHKQLPTLTFRQAAGGSTLWLTLPRQVDTTLLLEQAHLHQLSFLPGNACFPTHVPTEHIRISFAGVPLDELPNAIEQLCRALHTFQIENTIEQFPSF